MAMFFELYGIPYNTRIWGVLYSVPYNTLLCVSWRIFLKKIILIVFLFVSPIVIGADCDKTYKGKYVWGHEVDSFQPCNSKKSYWVSASSWVKGPLLDYYKKLKLKPYEPIYIEFRGHVLNEVVDGFAGKL